LSKHLGALVFILVSLALLLVATGCWTLI